MYKFTIKHTLPDIERMMDDLIAKPLIVIDDDRQARRLGIYAKPLREEKILVIASDPKLKETSAYLKCNNVLKPGKVQKKKGKKIEYIFDDIMIPRTLY